MWLGSYGKTPGSSPLPDLALTAPPPRTELLRQLRPRLTDATPGLRVVAERLLGADVPIDFVGIEPDGRVALVLVGDTGEDLELVARGLAQKAWVEPRLRDWLQLAPELGVRPEAGVRVVLLCPDFRPESRVATRALGAEAPLLAVYRCIRNGAGVETLVEPLGAHTPQSPSRPETPEALTPPPFRTGLTDSDLGLSPEEQREFE
jgi:hypothetical protein